MVQHLARIKNLKEDLKKQLHEFIHILFSFERWRKNSLEVSANESELAQNPLSGW